MPRERARAPGCAAGRRPARPEYLVADGQGGLVVRHYNREGRVREYDFTQLPVPAPMRASLAALFACGCRYRHPQGPAGERQADEHNRHLQALLTLSPAHADTQVRTDSGDLMV